MRVLLPTWLELAVCRCSDDIDEDTAPLMHMDYIAERQI